MIALLSVLIGVLVIFLGFFHYARVTGGLISLAGLFLLFLTVVGVALIGNGFGWWVVIPQ